MGHIECPATVTLTSRRRRAGAEPRRPAIDVRQLRYFSALADTLHYGQAAERLQVSQSALSQTIRQLETELGVTLLNRTTRQVVLTPAGEFLRSEAQQMLSRLDETTDGVRRFSAGQKGLLRLGLTGTAAFAYLPQIARTLRQRLPEVELAVHADMLTPDQCDGIRAGSLDIGILRPPVVGNDIATTPFTTEPLLLAMPADHRLADRSIISVTDLRNEPWVTYSSHHSVLNETATRMCREAGFTPRREHAGAGTSVLLGLVAAGLGVALVPGGVRAFPMEGVVFHELDESEPLELVLAFHASGGSSVARLALPLLTGF